MIEIVDKKDLNRRREKLAALSERGVNFDAQLLSDVASIISDVRQRGDEALIDYTLRFDHVRLGQTDIRVSEVAIAAAAEKVDPQVLKALRQSIENVRRFHERELETSWEIEPGPGIMLGQRIDPIESVGLYVPGGSAAYPSSVVMNVVPAQVAGVRRIAITTPPNNLLSNTAVAAALRELQIDEVYAVGGAQAIAALTYGTSTIPSVDKITGPGNRFVAAAKKLVFGVVGIDSIAGPTEVVIIADESAPAEFVAADLLAQAEHAEDSAAVLFTTSESLAEAVLNEIERQLRALQRAEIIRKSLEKYGAIFITETIDEACALTNELAPEHVQIMTANPEQNVQKIKNAGAVFIGVQTPTAVGDYFAGPNHVLPTGGTARFLSPLGVNDFMKRTNVIRYSETALSAAAESIAALATAEGLQAHARSALIRSGNVR